MSDTKYWDNIYLKTVIFMQTMVLSFKRIVAAVLISNVNEG